MTFFDTITIAWDQAIPFLQKGPGVLVLIGIILILTMITSKIIKYIMTKRFEETAKLLKVDKTQFTMLKHMSSFLVWMVGIGVAIYSVPSLRTLAVSLFAGAGVLAIVIGFASQKAVSNIVSGIFIAIFQPFRVGDIIKFADKIGVVEDITLRHTIIKNFENRRFVIPNSVISEETIENFNLNEDKTCRYVEFGISYDSDIAKAMKIMQEEAMKHPEFIDNRSDEDKKAGNHPITVRVLGFGDSSVNLRAWVWAKDPGAAFRMGTDLNKIIKERFDREGIEIPFPYRTIVFKDDIEKEKQKSLLKKQLKRKPISKKN